MITESEGNQTSSISDQARSIGMAVVLVIALLLLSRNINRMFFAHHDWNSAAFCAYARNHIHHGLGYTKLFSLWDFTPLPPDEQMRYLNHPPLLAVFTAIPMLVFGDHEWVGRSVPIATTLGSALLLMVIISRLHSPALGLLSGFFYVILPVTAYFGRMLGHESPGMFFNLLMLHGYMEWAGLYGTKCRPKAGAVCYTLGVVLGIGTGWISVLMAAFIWLWQLVRIFINRSGGRLLLWLTLLPAVSLAAVLVHILWGCRWDTSMLGSLLLTRAVGTEHEQILWAEWFYRNYEYLVHNVSWFGIGAGVIYLPIIFGILRYTDSHSTFRSIVRSRRAMVPVMVLTLQGVIWIFVFKRQSWMHDYWQYFIAPFFAVALGSVVLAGYILFSKLNRRAALWLTLLLIALPVPSFTHYLDQYHQRIQTPPEICHAFKELANFVPDRVPVMTSQNFPITLEPFGSFINRYPHPPIAYYANRSLIHSTDIDEINANRQGCAAYVMYLTNDPKTYRLAQQLDEKYELLWRRENYMIFLLQ